MRVVRSRIEDMGIKELWTNSFFFAVFAVIPHGCRGFRGPKNVEGLSDNGSELRILYNTIKKKY